MKCSGRDLYNFYSESFASPPRSSLVTPKTKSPYPSYCECISSYISRLATANGLSHAELFLGYIDPLTTLSKQKPIIRQEKEIYSINGTGKRAYKIDEALSALTTTDAQREFASFTFVRNLIGECHRQVVNRGLAWCPLCLAENDASEVFIPLYWQSYIHQKRHSILNKWNSYR